MVYWHLVVEYRINDSIIISIIEFEWVGCGVMVGVGAKAFIVINIGSKKWENVIRWIVKLMNNKY